MNFEKVQRKNRKAISPVLATVILIAITLIAAIAIAGFVFGLFGSFTSSAQVSAQVSQCTLSGAAPNTVKCVMTLTNSGTSNTAANGCSINDGGAAVASTPTGAGIASVPAGGTAALTCTSNANQAEPAIGSEAVGSVSLTNGATVPFTSVWS